MSTEAQKSLMLIVLCLDSLPALLVQLAMSSSQPPLGCPPARLLEASHYSGGLNQAFPFTSTSPLSLQLQLGRAGYNRALRLPQPKAACAAQKASWSWAPRPPSHDPAKIDLRHLPDVASTSPLQQLRSWLSNLKMSPIPPPHTHVDHTETSWSVWSSAGGPTLTACESPTSVSYIPKKCIMPAAQMGKWYKSIWAGVGRWQLLG